MKRGKIKMILYLILVLILGIVIYLKIPYSKLSSNFSEDVKIYKNKFQVKNEFITENDIKQLPPPVQKHFIVSGLLGTKKKTFFNGNMKNVPLKNEDGSNIMVDYTLYSFSDEPIRLAYIKSSKFGIPFEGYDSLQNGKGFMKGVIGKTITLFNQQGKDMDKGQLATYLGECFLIPSSLFNGYIKWNSIDEKKAKATIEYKGMKVSGIFTFNNKGFVESFITDERANVKNDGRVEHVKWSGIYENYVEKDGIYIPTRIKAVWHYKTGDLVYFDANNITIKYDED